MIETSGTVDGYPVWIVARATGVTMRITNAADDGEVIEKKLGGTPVKAEQIVDVIRGVIDGFKAAQAREAVNVAEMKQASALLGLEAGSAGDRQRRTAAEWAAGWAAEIDSRPS